jgi:hypothetical protein
MELPEERVQRRQPEIAQPSTLMCVAPWPLVAGALVFVLLIPSIVGRHLLNIISNDTQHQLPLSASPTECYNTVRHLPR